MSPEPEVNADEIPKREKEPSSARAMALFMTFVVGACGLAFCYKIFRFTMTLWKGGPEMLGFAIIPVGNYLAVAAGFLMLLVWAFAKGQFSDIERAKYELLEDELKYDELEKNWRAMQRQGGR